jgi:hypothetical protein
MSLVLFFLFFFSSPFIHMLGKSAPEVCPSMGHGVCLSTDSVAAPAAMASRMASRTVTNGAGAGDAWKMLTAIAAVYNSVIKLVN